MRATLQALILAPIVGLPLQAAQDLVFKLPTENDALYRSDNEGYFMYCDRWFEGKHLQPWEAGSYGYTRTAKRIHNGNIICTKLHEGIDVKPIRRDSAGEPLDEVHPIAPGVVAYISNSPGASNYGRYVVIAHEVPEGTIYSLYAHLRNIKCEVGQQVGYRDVIGGLGYSGVGLNRVRAHCHLELCLMVHAEFHKFCPANNKHGLFNGHNLIGIDAADVLKHCQNGAAFSLSSYFNTLSEHYRVRVPRDKTPDLLKRHPFLYKGDWGSNSPALDISFTAEGVPISIRPADTTVTEPTVVNCKPMPVYQNECTAGRLAGKSTTAHLTASGKTFINRFLWQEPEEGSAPPQAQD